MSLLTTIVDVIRQVFVHTARHRDEARHDRIAQSREATDRLLSPLRRLRALGRDSFDDMKHPRAWSEAITEFAHACDDYAYRLPDGWGHLQRSVRSAVGEFAGGVVFSDLDKRMVDYPLPQPDPEWLSNAVEYLDYVIGVLQRWRDAPQGRTSREELIDFDSWLGRRR